MAADGEGTVELTDVGVKEAIEVLKEDSYLNSALPEVLPFFRHW